MLLLLLLGHDPLLVHPVGHGFILADLMLCHLSLMVSLILCPVLTGSVCRQLSLLALFIKMILGLKPFHLELTVQRARHLIRPRASREVCCDGSSFLSCLLAGPSLLSLTVVVRNRFLHPVELLQDNIEASILHCR